MFSSMIQNLLSSSGKSSAMQRAVQMNNYVNNFNSQWTPVDKNTNAVPDTSSKVQSFDNVLKNSAQVKFGDLLTNPSTRVNANIYSAKAEMATENYVILMTTVNDSKEGFDRLADALYKIDNKL